MNILYDRRKTEDRIEYEFHYMPLVSALFFVCVGGSLTSCCKRAPRTCAGLLILWIIGMVPAWAELEKAMRAGPVAVSGSKFSCKNPLKVVISKKGNDGD